MPLLHGQPVSILRPIAPLYSDQSEQCDIGEKALTFFIWIAENQCSRKKACLYGLILNTLVFVNDNEAQKEEIGSFPEGTGPALFRGDRGDFHGGANLNTLFIYREIYFMKRIFNLGLRSFMDWRKLIAPLAFASLFCISTGTYVSAQQNQIDLSDYASVNNPADITDPYQASTVITPGNVVPMMMPTDNDISATDLQQLADIYNREATLGAQWPIALPVPTTNSTTTIDVTTGGTISTGFLYQRRYHNADTVIGGGIPAGTVSGTDRAAFLFDGYGIKTDGAGTLLPVLFGDITNSLVLNNTSGSALVLDYSGALANGGRVMEITNMVDVTIDGGLHGITLQNGKLAETNGTAYGGGGRATDFTNSVTITNLSAIGNQINAVAGAGGGGYFIATNGVMATQAVNNTSATLNDVSFSGNTISNVGANNVIGGGLAIGDVATINIGNNGTSRTDNVFSNNTITSTDGFSGVLGGGVSISYGGAFNNGVTPQNVTGTYQNMTVQGNTAANISGVVGVTAGGGMNIDHNSDRVNTIASTFNNVDISLNLANANSLDRTFGGGLSATIDPALVNPNANHAISFNNSNISANAAVNAHAAPTFAVDGGGIHVDGSNGGSLILSGTTVGGTGYYDALSPVETQGNLAQSSGAGGVRGGGIFMRSGNGAYFTNFTADQGTAITFNVAEALGAGAANGGGLALHQGENATFNNFTLSDNIARSATGNARAGGGNLVNVRNAQFGTGTISGNLAVSTGAGFAYGGGVSITADGIAADPVTGATLASATFTGTTISDNIADSWGGIAHGGGVMLWGVQAINGDLVQGDFTNVMFSGNSVFSGGIAPATGGAVAVWERAGATFTNSTFDGNVADATINGGTGFSQGGAAYVHAAAGPVTFTDSNFLNNSAVGDGAQGGAIYADSNITIEAVNKDVVFSGNTAGDGSLVANGNSVFSNANVTYNAGAGRVITDYDGVRIAGTLFKEGDGFLKLRGGVHGGTLDTVGGGVVEFDAGVAETAGNVFDGVNHNLATDSIRISGTTSDPVTVAAVEFTNGFYGTDNTNADGEALRVMIDDAIDNTYSQMVTWHADWINIRENGSGRTGLGIFDLARAQANMSDVRLTSLMMHNNRAVFGAANNRMGANFDYWGNCQTRKNYCGTTCGQSYGRGLTHSAWVNYVGRSSELQSSWDLYNGRSFDIESNGVQVGLDLVSTANTQFGIMFGYEDQKSELGRDRVNADDYYFGIYGARKFCNGWDLRAAFGYGSQDYDMVRYTPLDAGNNYLSSFDGNTYELNFELGRRTYLSQCFSFRPVIGFDFYWNDVDAATEVPPLAYAVSYDKMKYNQAMVRIGSDAQLNLGRLTVNGGLFYSYDMADDSFSNRATEVRGYANTLRGCDLGQSVLSLNIGGNYYLNQCRTFAVYGGYNADFYLDRDDNPVTHSYSAGIQWRF